MTNKAIVGIICFAASSLGQSDVLNIQKWQLTQEEDAIDGSYSASAELSADQPFASMSVKCTNSKVWLFVELEGKEMTPNLKVTTKLDNDKPISTRRWNSEILSGMGWVDLFVGSGGYDPDFIRGRTSEGISDEMHMRKPIKFLQTMMNKKKLAIRTAVKNEPLPVTATFDITGSEKALTPILENCKKR